MVRMLFALSTSLLLVSCGDPGPRRYEVAGTVTFDGKPLPDGEILFVPTNRIHGPTVGKIKSGAFRLYCVEGPMRVEILANREVQGKSAHDKKGPEVMNYIPARYNSESRLTAEVSPTEPNRIEFKVEPN